MSMRVTWYVQEDSLVYTAEYPGMYRRVPWYVKEGNLVSTGG
jgi:hypothetical protein